MRDELLRILVVLVSSTVATTLFHLMTLQSSPMLSLKAEMQVPVFSACILLASLPYTTVPSLVKQTTEGQKGEPSSSVRITGAPVPSSMIDTVEFVVPKSIPTLMSLACTYARAIDKLWVG